MLNELNKNLHLTLIRNWTCTLPNPLTTLHLYRPASVDCTFGIFNRKRLINRFVDDHIGSRSSLFFDHWIDKSGVLVTGHCNSIGSFSSTFNVTKLDAFGRRIGGPKMSFIYFNFHQSGLTKLFIRPLIYSRTHKSLFLMIIMSNEFQLSKE